ncbi:cytosolic sulfotransferase 5-like [Panicum miliaceum]|uniref:Sulfotransferase n=1 Tax=Panicum miliaceum TaxID=4540 RepID=A0A3L6PGE8_PANMI|nr:cytosolic sulfotransferase 5-like [Panicum miliaceum]
MAQAQTKTKHVRIEEEDESLISALPTREGWWEPFFLLQGFWLSPSITKSVMVLRDQFHPRHNDISLATYPKCGTTWLKALAFAITNGSDHPVTGYCHPLLSHNPHDLMPKLERPFQHLTRTLTLGRVVHLCREPKDVLCVRMVPHQEGAPRLVHRVDRAFEFFCEGFSFYGPIWEHYLGYWKQSKMEGEKGLFLNYDEMIAEPTRHVKMLAEFLRVPFTDEESRGAVEEVVRLCSFQNLKSLPVNSQGVSKRNGLENSSFFRTGKVGDWTNHMTVEMAQKLDCIIEEKLRGSGLTF